MQRILPSARSIHWGYFDAKIPPAAQVRSGERFFLRSLSADPSDSVPPHWLPPETHEIFDQVRDRGPGPHILTGPVYVQGAHPGSVLQVEIASVRLGAPYGYNRIRPLGGLFTGIVESTEQKVMPIDMTSGMAEVLPGVHIATRPFFGIMGVAPPPGWGRISSAQPRKHGGNIDNKELTAGTVLYLPVWVEGALFSAGDGHGAQGDGEIDITALETSLEAEFSLTVREDFELTLPIAVTPTHLITMGFDEDLDQAARTAVGELLQFMEQYCDITWKDAYRLARIAADLRVTQVVNGNKGIHVMFERSLLEQLNCRFRF